MGMLEQAQGPAVPQLADAAAQAGAPGIGAEAGAGGPPPGMPAGGPPPGAGGPPQAGPAPGAPPGPGPVPGAGAPPPAASPKPAGAGGAPSPASASGGRSAPQLPMQPGTPEEQKEYERAMRAVVRVLYGNDETARGIVDQIDPNDIVSSTSKVSMIFVKELDRKINMHEKVIASVTQEAVTRIAELAEARHGVEYQKTDMEKIIGATWEGIQGMFGGDPQNFTRTVQGLPPETLSALKDQHESILASAKPME